MKKLFMIMTLFTSSFLFLGDVKAYEYSKEISFDYINEDFYSKREEFLSFLENDTTRSDYYLYYAAASTVQKWVVFSSDFNGNGNCKFTDSSFTCSIYSTYTTYNFNKHAFSGGGSSITSYILNEGAYIIDTNIPFIIESDSFSSTITYTLGDFKLVNTANGTDRLYTLYDMYQEYQSFQSPSNSHQEELETLESFYSVIIEKLGYLAEAIVSNYIYLSIIAIFILIFVFMLIFRRFL